MTKRHTLSAKNIQKKKDFERMSLISYYIADV